MRRTPTRQAICAILADGHDHSLRDICRATGRSPRQISATLSVLKTYELVDNPRHGYWRLEEFSHG